MVTIKNKHEKARFGIVGATSTAIDFGVLFVLHALGVATIPANFVSTSLGFCFSFTANRHYTFKVHGGLLKRQITLFLVVTLIGIWVIQPVIIFFVEPLIANLGFSAWVDLAYAKLIATGVTMFWNYILYSRVVFKKAD